jgi:hypothetical protein
MGSTVSGHEMDTLYLYSTGLGSGSSVGVFFPQNLMGHASAGVGCDR